MKHFHTSFQVPGCLVQVGNGNAGDVLSKLAMPGIELSGYRWSPVRTLPVVPLWCELGRCSRTFVVIKLRRTSAFPTNFESRYLERRGRTPGSRQFRDRGSAFPRAKLTGYGRGGEASEPATRSRTPARQVLRVRHRDRGTGARGTGNSP